MILGGIDEATTSGARLAKACQLLGLPARTIQRWRANEGGEDRRCGPDTVPTNKLSPKERAQVLLTVNSPEFRDLSPKQIVPLLADQGKYLASESTVYRILRKEKQLLHRESYRSPTKRHKPAEYVAIGPNEVWSWDITYLKSQIRGEFFRLYMVVDIWSRKIVAWEVHAEETSENAAALLAQAYRETGASPGSLVVHMDNGGPMKGATLTATLQKLGVMTSYSRPSVSNDNPYSESLFRTLKYRPVYPSGAFESIEAARKWVAEFVRWYNTEHLHSAIRFVTPQDRHEGRDPKLLEKRKEIYIKARLRNPERWSGAIRSWNPIEVVKLNPDEVTLKNIV